MYVGRKLCKKNFKLFKRTLLGILFPVLLVLNPLVVNGSIPLSWDLMGHLTDTKQGGGTRKSTRVRSWLWEWWRCDLFSLLLLLRAGHYDRWMLRVPFLHGDLKEAIYITPPPGLFSIPFSDICKLKKSLCGLNRLRVLGLMSFDPRLLASLLSRVNMILLCFFARLLKELFCS